MSYQFNNRSGFSNRGRAVRGHRDSDATLTDFQPAEFERPPRSDYGRPEQRYDDQSNNVGHSQSEQGFVPDSSESYNQGRKGYHQDSQPRRRSVRFGNETYRRSSLSSTPESPYCTYVDESSPSKPGLRRRMRDPLHEQIDDYDYRYIQDEDYENYSTPAPSKCRGDHDNQNKNSSIGLPQPVTTPQFPPSPVQYGFLPFVHPQKEKKASLTKRFKKAFKEMTADPENEILGCVAGHPTPAHILEVEAEQEELEEEKRREAQRERDERLRQSRLRKQAMQTASKYNHERQRRPAAADREFISNDDITHDYDRDLASPHENDKTGGYRRRSTLGNPARHQSRI